MLLRRAAAVLTLSALVCGPSLAKEKPAPVLDSEHEHPSGAFTFRTPASWTVRPRASNPDVLEAVGDDVLVRFLFRWGEIGYDGLHVDCMLERLAPPMDIQPRVEYEYDFLSGGFGPMRALDSAFTVTYDSPIRGQRQWRQRNLTLVGAGESLCVISYAPLPLWKKDKKLRALLDAVVRSVSLKPQSSPSPGEPVK
jgi:hypothetical protein